MNLKQAMGFLFNFLVFCIGASLLTYPMGSFDYLNTIGGLAILGVCYALSGVFMYRYCKEHPAALGGWFQ